MNTKEINKYVKEKEASNSDLILNNIVAIYKALIISL
jgi:hypothetical protein